MRRIKILKMAAFILIGGVLLQTAIMAYTGVFSEGDVDIGSVEVSEEIQNLIKAQDENQYERNLRNYKEMIVLLNVHDNYKNIIEDMVRDGKKITDIMIAYNFLNECYGKVSQLKPLVEQKESGESWVNIFKKYNRENKAFEPRSFDFAYLETLMSQEGITSDDIMIADRISQNAGTDFSEVIGEKASGKSWRDVSESYGIVNGQETIPRVSITQEQLKKYSAGGVLTEEQVTEVLVVASKLGLNEQTAIDKAKGGFTTEQFFAEALEKKYY